MSRSRPAAAIAVLAVLGVALVAILVAHRPPAATKAVPVPTSAATDALRVLHEWDSRRAEAFAVGSADRLRRLYVAGSAAGAADLALLQRYRDRGLRVAGMRTQLLSVTVTERRPARWAMRVTDRLEGAVAVHGRQRIQLPRDTSSTHLITMQRAPDGRWQVAAVSG